MDLVLRSSQRQRLLVARRWSNNNRVPADDAKGTEQSAWSSSRTCHRRLVTSAVNSHGRCGRRGFT
jgi:hypothetical protein